MTAPNIELAFEGSADGVDGLLAFLQEEERRALDDELNDERAVALDFYNGLPFGDEEEGRSQVVTRDVAEVVDYMTVSILRTMVSSERVIEFQVSEPPQPPREPDESGAMPPKPPTLSAQIAAAVSQEFFQGQDGYRLLHDWIKAGLLEKSAVVKVCVEERMVRREATLSGEQIAQMQAEGIQFIASSPVEGDEELMEMAWLEKLPPTFRDYLTPNEEFLVADDARDLDYDCAYANFLTRRSISQIAEMGFDVSGISDNGYRQPTDDPLSIARDGDDVKDWGYQRQGANRRVWLLEEYCTYDLNGDGIAERLKVHRVGSHILNIEEVEQQPGVVWCPFPMPGRIVGQSLADKTMDIQRTRSVAMRQTLDGFYFANNPRTYISEQGIGDNTIDDLLTVRPGQIVRYAGIAKPEVHQGGFDPSAGITLMEVLAGEKEVRTGITRLNQGLDADALNKTATGTALMQASGQQIEEYIARLFAEAFARLQLKKYHLMRRYGRPMSVPVDGQQIEVDPRLWPDEASVKVRVGLGSGRKDERIQYRTMLMGQLGEAVQLGSRISDDSKIYNMFADQIEDMGLGPVREYLVDPSTLPPEQEKPDPQMAKVQADAMLQANKIDADNKHKAAQLKVDAGMKQQQLDYELQAAREKSALDESLQRDRSEFEASLALRQQQFEEELALRRLAFDQELARKKSADDGEDDLPNKRPGGDLDK